MAVAPRRLDGRVCVVNGAASTIGRAVAERFAAEGAVVVGVDRVAHSVGDRAVRADLTDEPRVREMYAEVVRAHGRLDVIYNNIGLMDRADHAVLDTDLDTWRRVQDANLTSVFLSCKHGIPPLRDTEPAGGSVINAASFLAVTGSATAPMAYAAAKAGVVQLTRDLGVHLARSGVRVNAVLFGPIDTPDQRAVFDRNPGALAKRLVHWPTGRFGTLAEAAGAVAFLASDDAGPNEPAQHHRCRAAAGRRHHGRVHRPGVTRTPVRTVPRFVHSGGQLGQRNASTRSGIRSMINRWPSPGSIRARQCGSRPAW